MDDSIVKACIVNRLLEIKESKWSDHVSDGYTIECGKIKFVICVIGRNIALSIRDTSRIENKWVLVTSEEISSLKELYNKVDFYYRPNKAPVSLTSMYKKAFGRLPE